MLITLSRPTSICQSVAEVWVTVVAPLGAVSHRFYLIGNIRRIVYSKEIDFNVCFLQLKLHYRSFSLKVFVLNIIVLLFRALPDPR